MTLDLDQLFPFPLDGFQKQAIAALNAQKSAVVCAPTGSGKTAIAEYAIYHALDQGKRVFYTTPLKALSNQKYRDFSEQFQPLVADGPAVGLITGDTIIDGGAPVVIMTTEIYRNMLYETPVGQVGTSLEDVATVILDECHYISDPGRGTVWEECIIYSPPSIQLLALSATIGNPEEFTAWINRVRALANESEELDNPTEHCELINSDFRPVPLDFYFATKKGLFPLLDQNKEKLNRRLLATHRGKKRLSRKDCPNVQKVVKQLRDLDFLPAIYLIFSRRGCDRAIYHLNDISLVTPEEKSAIHLFLLTYFFAHSPENQDRLWQYLQEFPTLQEALNHYWVDPSQGAGALVATLEANPDHVGAIFSFLELEIQIGKIDQLEALCRGVAAHHAGVLPRWKELVEKLFERRLVKIVFATSTLSAGLNMPARTTVISALKKRNDEGMRLLTPSEFLQMAGRAGRRGIDDQGYVVTVQTPFEKPQDAAMLSLAAAESLESRFTPSYGMVLNLLQKHTLEESKELLTRSFAEYLIQQQLAPEKQAISSITTDLTRLDVQLAAIAPKTIERYQKLKERLREERRLLDILSKQAEDDRKKIIAPLIPDLPQGSILHLKGKHFRRRHPLLAVVMGQTKAAGHRGEGVLCLTEKNRWCVVTKVDVYGINETSVPSTLWQNLSPPEASHLRAGQTLPGDEHSGALAQAIAHHAQALTLPPEVEDQQKRLDAVVAQIEANPLSQEKNPDKILKRYQQQEELRKKLQRSQSLFRQHSSKRSYYWQDFLNLIKVLQDFRALDGNHPTPLGQVAAMLRGENELWLALALSSGKLDHLEPHQLAAAVSALILETPRSDSWTDYYQGKEVLQALGLQKGDGPENQVSLWELRRQLNQAQRHHDVNVPVWLESKFIGLVEQWALGEDWNSLCGNTSLDEGDIVRLLRRTIDVLWQLPQVDGFSPDLKRNAQQAIALLKRFPV